MFPGSMCDLRRTRNLWCLLLQGVHSSGEGQGWMSQDRQSGKLKDRFILWNEKVWFQKEVIVTTTSCSVTVLIMWHPIFFSPCVTVRHFSVLYQLSDENGHLTKVTQTNMFCFILLQLMLFGVTRGIQDEQNSQECQYLPQGNNVTPKHHTLEKTLRMKLEKK